MTQTTRRNQRAAELFGHIRRSAMTFVVAARTSPHRAAFETASIVPSISIAWATLPTTITTARNAWLMRHIRGRSRNRRRSEAKSAVTKIAHMPITPQTENGVGDWKRRTSITSCGLVIQRAPTWSTTDATSSPPIQGCTRRARPADGPGK